MHAQFIAIHLIDNQLQERKFSYLGKISFLVEIPCEVSITYHSKYNASTRMTE